MTEMEFLFVILLAFFGGYVSGYFTGKERGGK